MTIDISIDDLTAFDSSITPDRADALITGAIARAALIAPCLLDEAFDGIFFDAAKSILVQTILRWHQTKPGVTSETIGPFATSYGGARELFYPVELQELQNICGAFRTSTEELDSGSALPSWSFPTAEESREPDWVSLLVDP